MEKQLTLIIPAYNEEEALQIFLPEVIAHCKEHAYELIVVNDGSTDNTLNVLKSFESSYDLFKIIHLKVNHGYGGAIKAGIKAATTNYIITLDADGQHFLEDVDKLFRTIIEKDAEMVVGNRVNEEKEKRIRSFGKKSIRFIAKQLMPLNIRDINSGMKIYDTKLAQKYMLLCPDSMAYSDIILLSFVYQKHLVIEENIQIKPRIAGKSTISMATAFETVKEILNIVVLFNPMRVFFPIAVICMSFGILWGLPFLLLGRGVSNGAIITILSGIIFFTLGLIAEQLSLIIKKDLDK